MTDLGVIDFLSELSEVGDFHAIKDRTIVLNLGGVTCRMLDLDTLIAAKKAAGREKDRIGVWHLEAIRAIRDQQPGLFDEPGGKEDG